MHKVHLSDMTWVECEQAFATRKLAIVPLGSVEQHGPALPVGTDWMIAEDLADRVGPQLPESIVTPVVPVGNAFYHTDFSGTLAVPAEVLTEYMMSICRCLVRYGATHILFVNGHGGNMRCLEDVGYHFRDRGVPVATIQWWEVAGRLNSKWGMIGHGDIYETALMLSINPSIVDMSKARAPVNRNYGELEMQDLHLAKYNDGIAHLSLRTKDISSTGDFLEYGRANSVDYTTSPADATAEMGNEILAAVADFIVGFAKEFEKLTLSPVV